MKNLRMHILNGLSVLFLAAACTPATAPVAPLPTSSATLPVTAENKSLPTPISPAQAIIYNDLQVVMNEAEVTTSYLTEFGSNREPPAGKKIIWINILLKNIGESDQDLPAPEHFSVLNGTDEFKATYGHRQDHTDYIALTSSLTPGAEINAWLRFDIPAEAELSGLIFAFLPESSQVSLGFSSSDFSWADHPIYLWSCAP